jgi:uncharacterized alkaline shock family protein YloU
MTASSETAPPKSLGPNEYGRIEVSSRVVEKIAAQAAAEIPDAGGPAARMLGRQLPGSDPGGALDRLPKISADVDGQRVFLDVGLSVRWPAPVRQVTAAVRERLNSRVAELVGLQVQEINVRIVDLVTATNSTRVR